MTRRTVAIRMTPEHSGTNATLPLARRLRERGHRVVYFAAPAMAGRIAGEGFEVEPIPGDHTRPRLEDLDDVELRGVLPRMADHLEAVAARMPGVLRRALQMTARYAMRHASEAAELRRKNAVAARVVARLRPDVALVDVIVPWATLPFLDNGVRVVNANPSLVGAPTLAYPHVMSSRVPAPDRPIATALAALASLPELRHVLGRHAATWFGWYPLAGFSLATDLRHAGVRLAPHDMGFRTRLPEIVFMPSAFDYPAARRRRDRHYAGGGVDRRRHEPAFAWERLDRARLAYCSLGTLANRALVRRVAALVVETFRHRPDWDVVIAGGHGVEIGELPPNVHAVSHAPQLAMLARAHLFITHAGAASVCEAIELGVPMIALPYGGDQFGLAARVAYHRLGRVGDAWTIDAPTLGALVDHVTGDPAIPAAMQRMQTACDRAGELAGAVALVEELAA